MSIALQPAFVLHHRSYRETSLLVELFTQDYGRITVVARGIGKARSRSASSLQPFRPIWISCYGKGELLTLTQVEPRGFLGMLSGKNLRCGFYLNELLIRLLPKQDPHVQLFDIYQQTLRELQEAAEQVSEKTLRLFEKKLLVEIGYGLSSQAEEQYEEEGVYFFDVERGFLPYARNGKRADTLQTPTVFSGKTLNALLAERFDDNQLLQDIKHLMRFVFASLLGGRPLESRRLFENFAEALSHV